MLRPNERLDQSVADATSASDVDELRDASCDRLCDAIASAADTARSRRREQCKASADTRDARAIEVSFLADHRPTTADATRVAIERCELMKRDRSLKATADADS
jgi:hypothetical protein